MKKYFFVSFVFFAALVFFGFQGAAFAQLAPLQCVSENASCQLNNTTIGICKKVCSEFDNSCGLSCSADPNAKTSTALPTPSTSTTQQSPTQAQSSTSAPVPVTSIKRTGPIVPSSQELFGLPDTSITTLITNLMGWLLYIFGFIAIIAFIISGLQYLTSAGDSKQIETAESTMKYAMLGVLVTLGSLVVIKAIERMLRASLIF